MFLRDERRRILRGGDAERLRGAREVDEKPKQGRRVHWYTRFHMWHMAKRVRGRGERKAARGALHAVEGLWADEYAEALAEVNMFLKCNEGLRRAGGVDIIERDYGPGNAAEAHARPELAAYNGRDGGKYFKWYEPGRFLQELRRRGAEVATCTEDQCMQALASTSEELKRTGGEMGALVPYAGPQCYSQLTERLMANAVETKGFRRHGAAKAAAGDASSEGEELGGVVEQVQGCWLRCSECEAWRLVDRGSLPSLRSEAFQKVLEGSEQGFWAVWLNEARSRYEVFTAKGGAGRDVCMPCEGSEGAGAAGSGGAGAIGGGVAVEGGRVAEMEAMCGSDVEDEETMRTDVRMALEQERQGLGVVGVGFVQMSRWSWRRGISGGGGASAGEKEGAVGWAKGSVCSPGS